MSQEEEKVLKDLVTQCLATKGFLGKIQAEIRAGVFVALEEQDVLKDIFINKSLKDFVETTHGALVISLVREFLEFFNLQFTNMVFDPETHAGIDYKFEGRMKLASDLNLTCDEDKDVPLLALLLQSMDTPNKTKQKSLINGFSPSEQSGEIGKSSNGLDNDPHSQTQVNRTGDKGTTLNVELMLDSNKESSRASSDNVCSLNGSKAKLEENSSSKIGMDQLNQLLQYEPDGGDCNYEEDFVSSGSEKKDSTESEIEEELPSNSIRSTADELTVDTTISKESGQGDYTEKISNG